MIEIITRRSLCLIRLAIAAIAVVVVALGASLAVFAYDPSCGTGPGLTPCSFPEPPPVSGPTGPGGPVYDPMQANHDRANNLSNEAVQAGKNGDLDRAVESWQQAHDLWPENRTIEASLKTYTAEQLARKGRYAEAMEHAYRAWQIDKGQPIVDFYHRIEAGACQFCGTNLTNTISNKVNTQYTGNMRNYVAEARMNYANCIGRAVCRNTPGGQLFLNLKDACGNYNEDAIRACIRQLMPSPAEDCHYIDCL